jgi:chaperonin cofactor prefoldin
MAQLTQTEISSLPMDTSVYEGVGKMYDILPVQSHSACSDMAADWDRFVALPVPALKSKLETQIKEGQKEVETLGKRVQSLEITQKNSKEHIDRMLRGGAGVS